jgi:hypothetical protein
MAWLELVLCELCENRGGQAFVALYTDIGAVTAVAGRAGTGIPPVLDAGNSFEVLVNPLISNKLATKEGAKCLIM